MRRMFGIKLTEDERALIERAAAHEGRPPSNLARHLILTALRDDRTDPRATREAKSVPAKAEALSTYHRA